MALAILAVPLLGALSALLLRKQSRVRALLLPTTALTHLVLTLLAIFRPDQVAISGWLALDAPGRFFLLVTSVIFVLGTAYSVTYLGLHPERDNRVFCVTTLIMLAALSAVAMAAHLGLLWVAIEASTLAAAPLVYFNKNPASIEATWKYLMVGSVGIALALLGSLFLGYAALAGTGQTSLDLGRLADEAPRFSRPWLRAAFVVLLVGYGTKMGLAPMHTWKPDAYGEAPGAVGALLAGAMTNAAFLALLRVYRIVDASGEGEFARQLLVTMGLVSMGWAAVFLVRQPDFKRMLGYSSVEHMGILVLGVGIGGAGTSAALLHSANNGLAKVVMFLAAANIHRAFGSKRVEDLPGAIRHLPVSAVLFVLGFLAATGAPPFGPFVSLFGVARASLGGGRWFVGSAFLLLLAAVFAGMAATVLDVAYRASSERTPRFRDRAGTTLAPALALGLLVVLGVALPRPFSELIGAASRALTGAG